MAYLHGLYQLTGYPRYTGDIITFFTCLQLLAIDNNPMLGATQFMVYFQVMHFDANKTLYINFQRHALIFCSSMLSTIYGGGHVQCYVLPTSACATKNNYLPIYYRYSGFIFQHSIATILNVSQRFIKSLHQPKKPHGLVGQFTNRQKLDKELYDSIDAFIRQLKEDIG